MNEIQENEAPDTTEFRQHTNEGEVNSLRAKAVSPPPGTKKSNKTIPNEESENNLQYF